MMRKEGKKEDLQQGSLVSSIGNIKGYALFREEEGMERRGVFEIVFFFFIFPSFMKIFGIWKRMRGGEKGKEEDLMRMNPTRS